MSEVKAFVRTWAEEGRSELADQCILNGATPNYMYRYNDLVYICTEPFTVQDIQRWIIEWECEQGIGPEDWDETIPQSLREQMKGDK